MVALQSDSTPGETKPQRAPFGRKRRKVIFWIRIGVVVFSLFVLWQLSQRFELVKLGEDNCSPLSSFMPGVSLLVDRKPEKLFLDDAVLFEFPGDGLGLGRISLPPGSAPGTLRTESGFWILGDAPECHTPDSRDHGIVAPERIVARVLFPIKF